MQVKPTLFGSNVQLTKRETKTLISAEKTIELALANHAGLADKLPDNAKHPSRAIRCMIVEIGAPDCEAAPEEAPKAAPLPKLGQDHLDSTLGE